MKGKTTAPKNMVASTINDLGQAVTDPPVIGDRIAYGVVTAVNDKQQVQVQLYSRRDQLGNFQQILNGKFIPVATQQTTINLLYGELRAGLQVMIHWRGKLRPSWAIAHIIGDEELDILEEVALSTDVAGPPVAFLSGGMSDV